MNVRYAPGDRIAGRYEVHHIKTGGMGVVYFCYDHESGVPFAIKTFQDKFLMNKAARDRFTQEALTWVQLEKHRNIVRAHHVYNIEGKPYIFLEMVVGREGYGADLRSWLRRGPLDVVTALDFAIQFCLGMEHAQKKVPGLVHRDIKPENVLITQERVVKITDFGLVKTLEAGKGSALPEAYGDETIAIERPTLTRLGIIVGTPPYMSPEQCRGGPVDVRSDVYSFGCVLYEMLTGRWVFEAKSVREFLSFHITQEPMGLRQHVSALPADVEEAVMLCLRKDPGRRYQQFKEILDVVMGVYQRLTGEEPRLERSAEVWGAVELNNKGVSLANLGYPEDALSCYEQALDLDRQLAPTWVNKGNVLSAQDHYRDALNCYERALGIDPELALAWRNRGALLQRLGHREEALDCLERALRIDSRDAEAWVGKGKILDKLGRHEEAFSCFDQALQANPWHAEAWNCKGVVLTRSGRPQEALTCLERATQINPQEPKACNNYGDALYHLGRFREALDFFDRALRMDPQDAEAWSNKGAALDALGASEEALNCFNRALALDPQLLRAWNDKGAVLNDLGHREEALGCFERATELGPQFAPAWFNKGSLLVGFGRFREALFCFKHAQRLGIAQAINSIAICRRNLPNDKE